MEAVKSISDPELVANLRSGRNMEASIKSLYRDCYESLSWYVMNNSGTRQDAEDMFQEVMVRFIDLVQKDKFRGQSSIRTFLFSLNRHAWLNELKRRGREALREEKFEKAQDRTIPDTSELIMNREERTMLADIVGKLGETCKKILLMFYYENASISEILANLDYENEQVVRNKKYKCLKQLEAMIAGNPTLKKNLQNLLHG
jgi:RNA polymerase sigma factor (sigma-70 family)